MRRLAVLLLLPLLAACGSSRPAADPSAEEPTATVTATVTASPTATPTPDAEPDPAAPTGLAAGDDGTWSPWSKGGPPATDVSDIELPGFTSPSDNLGCQFGERGVRANVRCDRREGLGVDEPRPADCDLEWGDAVGLSGSGPGGLLCHADTVFFAPGATDGTRVLPYGDSVVYEGLTCTSRREGVQCLNGEGRGFVISRGAIVTR